ncbi:MAG: DUF423 domain-containing protein [Spirulinaceae cyanobacterium]
MLLAALFGGLAVAAGAFASHALQSHISDRALEIFQTGATYQMYHALALLLIALFLSRTTTATKWLQSAAWAFIIGILLFSGSLYALSLMGVTILGVVTPLGGVAFLGGWICLAIAAWQSDPLLK